MADTIFPINWTDKINSPDLLAFLRQFGDENYFDADQINLIKRALNNLNERSSASTDKIIFNAGFEINGLTFKLKSISKWEISGAIKSNSTDIVKPISLASPGMKARVIALLNSENSFYLKYGVAHAQFPLKPIKDAGTVELTDFTVTDSEVGLPTVPVVGDPFIMKNQFNQAGDVNGKFYIGQQSNFPINNPAITEVKGLCNVNEMEEGLYVGKFHYWANILTTSVWFRHLDNSDPAVRYPFYLPGEVDFELKPGFSILFYHSPVDIPINFEYGYLRFLSGTVPAQAPSVTSKPQKTITGNTVIDNSYNGCIVKVKATALITIPAGLVVGFEFDYATYTGVTATLLAGAGVTLNDANGLILGAKKMGTIFNDGTNVYEVRGEQNS